MTYTAYDSYNHPFPTPRQPPPDVVEKVGKLVLDARCLFDSGEFDAMAQAKFFRAVAEALTPAEPAEPLP
jgi:hypothetical protein